MANTTQYLPTHRSSPTYGDRVRETGPAGIIGHVHSVRHSAAGLEVKVYEDSALTGRWILAANLSILAQAPDMPIPCTFLGWSEDQLDAFARSPAARSR